MVAGSPQQNIDWTALRQQLLLEKGKLKLPAGWKLPIIPKIVTEFLQHANKADFDIRSLSRILEQDSNLTCELLKHVNSAAMGLRRKATTVHQALVNLGIRRSKMVLLTAAIHSSIKHFNNQLFDLHHFWADNLERSLFAREIAGEVGADLDLAYTGAMLQDFLLPVLSQFNVQTYVAYWKERSGVPCDLIEYELSKFGVQHAQVAAACLLEWSVPDELICSVLCHHMPYDRLADLGLIGTHVHAVAASSLIPISIPQYVNAAVRLSEWDKQDAAFDLCDIAERVDAYYLHSEMQSSDREPLVNRIETCLMQHLEAGLTRESLINRQLGNFIIESCIGEGAMGTVFRARHTMLQRPAAVKVLNKKDLSTLDISRFEREVQFSSRLTHPNTISIYDYGRTHDGLFYYVMEFVEGLTLKQLVQMFGPQPESRVIYILRQICQSLQEAHELGIIHRDIKPENIILSTRGQNGDHVTVLDFGLVMDTTEMEKAAYDECLSGTPLYMAPESIAQPGFASPACDLYAIGAVGYYLLCGQPLYTGNDALDICLKQLSEVPPPPSQRLKKTLAVDLEQIVISCLHKTAEKRPHSAAELETALAVCEHNGQWTARLAGNWWQEHVGAGANPAALATCAQDGTVIVGNESTMSR